MTTITCMDAEPMGYPRKKPSPKAVKLVLDLIRAQRQHCNHDDVASRTLARLDAAEGAMLGYLKELEEGLATMETLDTKRVLTIADLKTRLGRAAAESETLYSTTDRDVGHATAVHLRVVRIRALLDLETPLPTLAPTISEAPRDAANVH